MGTQTVQTRASGYSTETEESTTSLASLLSTITSSNTGSSNFTTAKQCEETQVIDDVVSTNIIVIPDVINATEKVRFQVTPNGGVSFPQDVLTPTLIVKLDELTEINSISIPRQGSQNTNVEQFQANFYFSNGSLLNERPILSSSSPQQDTTSPARVDSTQIPSNTFITRIELQIISTTDNQSPKSVMLNIISCTQPRTGN